MKMNQRTSFVLAKYCERRYLVILIDMYLSVDIKAWFQEDFITVQKICFLHICFSKRLTVRCCTRETYGKVPPYDVGIVSCDPNIIPRREAIQNSFKVDYL